MGGTGEVIDFSKKNPTDASDEIQRLSNTQPQQSVQVVGGGGYIPQTENPGPDAPEIGIHEGASERLLERIITDEDKIRASVKKPGDPEVRIREGITQQEWEDVKRDG